MNNTAMHIVHDRLRNNREVNKENKKYYLTSEADKQLFQLLNKIKQAKHNFEMHCASAKQDRKTPHIKKIDTIMAFYTEWYQAVAEAISYIGHCCPGGGLYAPDQTISDSIYNEVMSEINAFKAQKSLTTPATLTFVEKLDNLLKNHVKNPPIHRAGLVVGFLESLDETWRNQLQMLDDFYKNERPYQSNGEYTNPPQRDKKQDEEFKRNFLKQFSIMFSNLLNTLNAFNNIANSSNSYESISMNDVDDLKLLVENIEQLKDFLDEKNLQIVNNIFPPYKQRFMEDYEKFREKNNELSHHNNDDFDVK